MITQEELEELLRYNCPLFWDLFFGKEGAIRSGPMKIPKKNRQATPEGMKGYVSRLSSFYSCQYKRWISCVTLK